MELVEIVFSGLLFLITLCGSIIGYMIKDKVKKIENKVEVHASKIEENTMKIAVNTTNDENRDSIFSDLNRKVDSILEKISLVEKELSYFKGKSK